LSAPARLPDIALRRCAERDISAVAAIYGYHVRHGLASFETEPPSVDEMLSRYRAVTEAGFPYLVAETGGEIVGYAYASPYRARPAYRHTAENSVYIRQGCEGRGIGKRLLAALLAECEAIGLRQIVAVIGDSANHASIGLHRSLGFTMVGTIRAAGYKFDRWVDTVLMQCAVGAGVSAPPETAAPERGR
jgi:L-amino acid N-acyltransferase YncA